MMWRKKIVRYAHQVKSRKSFSRLRLSFLLLFQQYLKPAKSMRSLFCLMTKRSLLPKNWKGRSSSKESCWRRFEKWRLEDCPQRWFWTQRLSVNLKLKRIEHSEHWITYKINECFVYKSDLKVCDWCINRNIVPLIQGLQCLILKWEE